MNERIHRTLPYLPAAAVGLLTIAIVWNILHLAAAAWSTHSVVRHVEKLEVPSAPDPGQKNPESDPGSKSDRSPKNPRAKRGSSKHGGGQDDLGPYAEILKKGLFAKAPEQSVPVCTGILGDAAIINDEMVNVGQRVGEWKLVEIGQNKIVLEKDGKKQEIKLFSDLGDPVRPEGPPPGSPGEGPPRPPMPASDSGGPGPMVSTGPGGPPSAPSSGEGGPGGPSPSSGGGEGRTRMGISPEQYKNMSPEEREKFREEMRQRRNSGGEDK